MAEDEISTLYSKLSESGKRYIMAALSLAEKQPDDELGLFPDEETNPEIYAAASELTAEDAELLDCFRRAFSRMRHGKH